MHKQPTESKQIIEGIIFAVLSYLSILCIIPLVLKKDNPFVLDHSKQGLVLFVGEVAGFILHIVFGYWFLNLCTIVFGVYSVIGIIKVLNGQYVKLFFIHEIAQKITL